MSGIQNKSNEEIAMAPAICRSVSMLFSALLLTTLTACGPKESGHGQTLAKVDGEEITVHQLNEELQRLGNNSGPNSKQILDALVDRQVILNQAKQLKIDREPAVIQAIERAKAQIIVEAYLQRKIGAISKPTKQEVDDFYNKNPDLFSQRKSYELKQLIIESRDVNDEVKAILDNAKNLEDAVVLLTDKKVKFLRAQISRTGADLPPPFLKAIKQVGRDQLFAFQEGGKNVLVAIADIKDSPVEKSVALPQIEQFLINDKAKNGSKSELDRLRSVAKIEFFNQDLITKSAPVAAVLAPAATEDKESDTNSAIERGVSGLK